MGFNEDFAAAISELFSENFADAVTLSGTPLFAHVIGYSIEEDGRATANCVDVMFQSADVSAISYRESVLEIDGVSWRFPKLLSGDLFSKTYRFRNNERPNIGGR